MPTITLKRNNTAGAIPATNQLTTGEPAVNTADGYLYTKHTDGSILRIGTTADRVAVSATGSITPGTLQGVVGQIDTKTTALQTQLQPLASFFNIVNGKLGVGNPPPSSPSDLVHIEGAGATTLRVNNSVDSVSALVRAGTTGVSYGTSTSTPVSIIVNNQNAVSVDTSRRVTLPAQPRFHAYFSADFTTNGLVNTAATPVTPDQAPLNVGSVYSTTTGRFTAPVAGAYFIYAQAYFQGNVSANGWCGWYVRKNGSATSNVLQSFSSKTSSDNFVSPAAGRIVQLAAGDYLQFVVEANAAGVAVASGEGQTFFGAYLVG